MFPPCLLSIRLCVPSHALLNSFKKQFFILQPHSPFVFLGQRRLEVGYKNVTPANLPISLLFGVNAEAATKKKSEEYTEQEQEIAEAAQRKAHS